MRELDDLARRVRKEGAQDDNDALGELLDTLAGVHVQLGRVADACETLADLFSPKVACDIEADPPQHEDGMPTPGGPALWRYR